jgi:ankyrin repeat protein
MDDAIAIHEAFTSGDLELLRALLGNPSDFPNGRATPAAAGTILEYAIYHSPPPFVRTLLELGADPNYDGSAGFPSLIASSSTNRAERYEIVELLLAFGADIQQHGVNDYTPLHYAAAKNDLRLIKLLLARGADPDSRTGIDDFTTPLEEAESRGLSEALQILKEFRSLGKHKRDQWNEITLKLDGMR